MPEPLLVVTWLIIAALIARELVLFIPELRMLRSTSRIEQHHSTGLLNRASVPYTLEPEMRWAAMSGHRVGLARFHVAARDAPRALALVAGAMRRNERPFALVANELIAPLWVDDEQGCVRAVARLCSTLHEAGFDVVDVGMALMPEDGTDVGTLVELAGARRRPAHTWIYAASTLPVHDGSPQ